MDVTGKEIFATGKWNGMPFNEEDLDDIVSNFERFKHVHQVPLKFGHNDEQPITDGQPAIGWIKRVYRQGKKLLADFSDVPKVVADAIKKRLYRTVSVELLLGVDYKGERIDNLLDAVALLGADQPAVNTLSDLERLMAVRAEFSGGHSFTCETIKGNTTKIRHSEEEYEMDKKEVQEMLDAAVAPLKEQNDKLVRENDQLRKDMRRRQEEDETRQRREKEEAVSVARRKVNETLDLAVRCGSMTPAVRETYSRQIGVSDDDRVVGIDVDQIKTMFNVKEDENDPKPGARDKKGDDEDEATAAEKLMQLTREFQLKHNISDYRTAFSRVSAAHPELHREYLDSNGTK